MSRQRRTGPEIVVASALGGGAIAWVLIVFGTVLFTGTGTGNFFDPWRALGRVLLQESTWLVALGGAVVGAIVGAVISARQNKQK